MPVRQEVLVEGMKCEHCEAHVAEALSKIPGVESVKADRTKKDAIVVSEKGISEEQAKEAVESVRNKKYLGIKTL